MSDSSGVFASCLCCKGSPPEERKTKHKHATAADKQSKSDAKKNAPIKSQPQTVITNRQPLSKSKKKESAAVRNGREKKDPVDTRDVVLEEGIDSDMAANLSELVTRLEKVTSRLESVAAGGGSSGGATDAGEIISTCLLSSSVSC